MAAQERQNRRYEVADKKIYVLRRKKNVVERSGQAGTAIQSLVLFVIWNVTWIMGVKRPCKQGNVGNHPI
ncbi:hypothetical protein K435DRAFT_772214 [Dendrothele bispora CBS 962.96]|uniref:Uncharacterized protein n=1 Tax=Dendrothele bispora (strain CBS 962.96) TaxID=1314807 RepID=A0A4S8MWW1_DENBC|nr:hypothetical protein K435DRAFT_772214 [Dendrothele bispora CBS 962.96]